MIRASVLLIALSIMSLSCEKDEDNANTLYTYKVTCASCEVSYNNPLEIAQHDLARNTWQHSVFMRAGRQLNVKARNVYDNGTVQVSIVKDDEVIRSNSASGPEAEIAVSSTAE